MSRRKENAEYRSFAQLTGDFNKSSMSFDDSHYRGETKTGPFAGLLCGKERFENLADNFRGHSLACITHNQYDMRSFHLSPGIGCVDIDIASLDYQLATVRHGITSIDAKVHQNLVDLGR